MSDTSELKHPSILWRFLVGSDAEGEVHFSRHLSCRCCTKFVGVALVTVGAWIWRVQQLEPT